MKRLYQDSFIFGETTSSHFSRVAALKQKLLFRGSYFFRGATFFEELPFSEQLPLYSSHFSQNSYFFRAKHLQSSYFLRKGSSLGQILFGTPIFLVEKLIRIKKFSEEVLFWNRYFGATFSEGLLFGKS